MVIESEIDKINNDNLKKKLEKLDKNLEQLQNLINTIIDLKKSENKNNDKIKKETENINKKIEDINNTVEEINNVNSKLTESLITKTELNKIILSYKTKLNNYLNQLNFTDFLLKKDELENEFLENINETKKLNDNILDDLDNFNNNIKTSIDSFLQNLIKIEQIVSSSNSVGGQSKSNNTITPYPVVAKPVVANPDVRIDTKDNNPFSKLKGSLDSIKQILETTLRNNKEA
jgi:DNA repair exonuclease SbcCD ATPase subunit